MTDLFGCKCCKCGNWHSHVFPLGFNNFICIECKYKNKQRDKIIDIIGGGSMKCSFCSNEFEERDIHESHDVPCYLFWNVQTRKERKQFADKFKRRWLCKNCHEKYEKWLQEQLINFAKLKGEEYFNKRYKDDSRKT